MSEQPTVGSVPTGSVEQAERLSALFEAHAERLYRLARRLAPTADDALDLVQEAFLKAARSLQSVPRGAKDEEAWLVRVLVNVRRDQWRKEAVRKRHDLELSHVPSRHDDPERAFLIRTIVWQALDYLSPRRRAMVVMHELEGLSVASIASLLGISAITVRWHLSRGRRDLAQQLRRDLGETDEQIQDSLARRRSAPTRSTAP